MNQFDKMVLGKDVIFTTDTRKTMINNNVLVVAASGAGKTFSVVEPNLLMTNNSSLIISDPKGGLVKKYKKNFANKGYKVKELDFIDWKGDCGYDPLDYVKTEQDALRLANLLVYSEIQMTNVSGPNDPYWNQMAEICLSAIIMAVMDNVDDKRSFNTVIDMISMLQRNDDGSTSLDGIFRNIYHRKGNCMAVRQWKKLSVLGNVEKTFSCVVSSLGATIGRFESSSLRSMIARSERIKFEEIAEEKTAVFIKCSDTDSSIYTFLNIFYAQIIDVLCKYADRRPDGKCKVPVRIILDDFATNVTIHDMPSIISTVRSREISLMLIVQSESQLEKIYGQDCNTIICNCDTYCFLGSQDLKTARSISERLDLPVTDILYMSIGKEYVFRRGSRPIECERFDIQELQEYKELLNSDISYERMIKLRKLLTKQLECN